MKFWFDFTSPPQVHFFSPLIEHYQNKGIEIICSAREFGETTGLLDQKKIKYHLIGKHAGGNYSKKVFSLLKRNVQLYQQISGFDVSFSNNFEAPFITWLKGKKAIVCDDNDIAPNWLYSRVVQYVFCPNSIDVDRMSKMGINKNKIIIYDGFKEDIYLAAYKPDPSFLEKLPFKKYIIVRPENLLAAYVPHNVKSIVPNLIDKLTENNFNILYLPRYKMDYDYVKPSDNIFIPNETLNGLDVCYYADAVLTGAGSFSREAALMGIPAVSFFAGNNFLSVDKNMFQSDKVFFSRNVDEIFNYIKNRKKKNIDFEQSKKVQKEFFQKLDNLIGV